MYPKLFMVLLGCRPKGRNTEQHDIFFGIGNTLADMKAEMQRFWPGSLLHLDAWREVTNVDGFAVTVFPITNLKEQNKTNLFFLNLGGYKEKEFEEFHYKMLVVANDKGEAVKVAKHTAFYKHTSLPGPGISHIDDRYGVDVDDVFTIKDILPAELKKVYRIRISSDSDNKLPEDTLHLGYIKWSSL